METLLSHLAAIAAALTVIAEKHETRTAEPTVAIGEPVNEPAKKRERKAKAEEPEPAKAKAEEPEPAKAKAEEPTNTATRADLRKLGTALVSGGKKTEFLAVLKKYGAANISALMDHEIDVILPELENILGSKLSEIAD